MPQNKFKKKWKERTEGRKTNDTKSDKRKYKNPTKYIDSILCLSVSCWFGAFPGACLIYSVTVYWKKNTLSLPFPAGSNYELLLV